MAYAAYKPPPGTYRAERIHDNITIDANGCWIWQLSISVWGYGRIKIWVDGGQKLISAHRYAYEALVGPIPDGLQIDHLCRVRSCVNPDHLEPVTPGENTRRRPKATPITACRRGHAFTPENTRLNPAGFRNCRACDRMRNEARSNPELAKAMRETGR